VFLLECIALPVGGKPLGCFPPALGVRLAYEVLQCRPGSIEAVVPGVIGYVGPVRGESALLDPPVLVAVEVGLVPLLPVGLVL